MNLLTEHSPQLRDFVQRVQDRAQLENYEEAHQLSRASLRVLGQSVSGGEAKRLAEWVPPELQDELTEQSGHASAFDKKNFLEKIGGLTYSVDTDRVEQRVTAVLQVLRASAKGGELDDTIAQLPPELSRMFG